MIHRKVLAAEPARAHHAKTAIMKLSGVKSSRSSSPKAIRLSTTFRAEVGGDDSANQHETARRKRPPPAAQVSKNKQGKEQQDPQREQFQGLQVCR